MPAFSGSSFDSLFQKKIKKKDIGDFCQKMAMLLRAGYDACSSAELLADRGVRKRRDKSAEGVRGVAELLLPALRDGYMLNEAMVDNPRAKKLFSEYVQQVKVGEESGKTADVLDRISEQIKNANKVVARLKSAMTYPLIVLAATFGVAIYLFTSVIPDMLQMIAELGVTELPWTTRAVMALGDFMKTKGIVIGAILLVFVILVVIYSKTIGQVPMARLATRIPLIGGVIENNALAQYYRSWNQMVFAGAEMSIALKSAAEAVSNLYLKQELMLGYKAFAENGIPVHEAVGALQCVRTLEAQTVKVATESGGLANALTVLAEDREFEANRAVDNMIAAVNPIMIVIVGIIVGVLVLSVYQPIISVSSQIKA